MNEQWESWDSRPGLKDFERIFHDHHAAVYHFLRRLLPSTEDVEDCVQETFLRFWRSRASYKEKGLARAYLFKIARNLAVDQIRRHQSLKEQAVPLEEMESSLEARADLDDAFEKRELATMVRKKVSELPISQRETFLMFRYHGMSYEEIADIQGVSVRTVDSRLYRAMKWLGQQLNGHAARMSEGDAR